jgi:hypothetical protein
MVLEERTTLPPLSEHEQRILEDIERSLQQEDPRLAQTVSDTSLYTHLAKRIRWATFAFFGGFVMLMMFWLSIWIALVGFGVMLGTTLLIYTSLKKIGADQLRSLQLSGFSLPLLLARLTGRSPER